MCPIRSTALNLGNHIATRRDLWLGRWLAKVSYVTFDRLDSLGKRRRADVNQFKTMGEISALVQFSKSDGVGKIDSSGFSGRH